MIGVPYAHRVEPDLVECPVCKLHIRLTTMKDQDSFAATEYAEHYRQAHPVEALASDLRQAPFAYLDAADVGRLVALLPTHPAAVAESLESDAQVHDLAGNCIKADVIRALASRALALRAAPRPALDLDALIERTRPPSP
jgi:hypothetical protein